jgi:hypothetical protein
VVAKTVRLTVHFFSFDARAFGCSSHEWSAWLRRVRTVVGVQSQLECSDWNTWHRGVHTFFEGQSHLECSMWHPLLRGVRAIAAGNDIIPTFEHQKPP